MFILCQFYEVDAETTGRLVDLARLAKASPWFHEYAGTLGGAADYLELELDAVQVAEFEADIIPGQLQTERYAHAVFRHGRPDYGDEQIAELVALRMERQRHTAERRPSLRVIIDEAALRRPIGGHAVMAEQLEHLAAMTRQPGLTIQVLPGHITGHAALGVPFTLITLEDGAQYVYRDGLTGGTYTDESHEVEAYREAWGSLQAQALGYEAMWDELSTGALGAVVLADTRRLDHCFAALDFFERRGIDFLVAVNQFDGAHRYRPEEVRKALDLNSEVPVVLCDARMPNSGVEVLISLVQHLIESRRRHDHAG